MFKYQKNFHSQHTIWVYFQCFGNVKRAFWYILIFEYKDRNGQNWVQYWMCVCVGTVITMSGTRQWHVSTTCWVSSAGWSTMARWSSETQRVTSAPARSPLSRSEHTDWCPDFTSLPSDVLLLQVQWGDELTHVAFFLSHFLPIFQSRYWSSDNSKNEVQGVVLNRAGEVVHRFGGLWHEGIFCDTLPTPQCIWKPSEWTSLPER